MKVLVLMVLMLVSQGEANNNENDKAISTRAPNMSAAQILNWKQFETLPIEKKIEYFDIIKNFLIKEENKWPDKKIASLTDLLFPVADAEEPSCPDYTNVSANVKKNMDLWGTHCIKAGFLVCVTTTGGCSSSDPGYLETTKKYCTGSDAGKLPCSPPLFMKTDGSTLCVDRAESIKNKSVTQTCLNAQKALKMTTDQYQRLFDENKIKFKDEYTDLTHNIRDFCAAPIGKKWGYDDDDCRDLTTQLDIVAPLTKGLVNKGKDGVTNIPKCEAKYKVQGQDLNIQLNVAGDVSSHKFSISAPSQQKWVVTECTGWGKIDPKVDISALKTSIEDATKKQTVAVDTGTSNEIYNPCLVTFNGDQTETLHFEGKSLYDSEECKIKLTKYEKDKPTVRDTIKPEAEVAATTTAPAAPPVAAPKEAGK